MENIQKRMSSIPNPRFASSLEILARRSDGLLRTDRKVKNEFLHEKAVEIFYTQHKAQSGFRVVPYVV